jgi:hypothetical protein
MAYIHDLRCEAAKEFMTYICDQGIEWDHCDGPLEIGMFLEDQLELNNDDDTEAESAAQVQTRIEKIVAVAVKEHTDTKSREDIIELYRSAVRECVLGQHYEQAEYRAGADK